MRINVLLFASYADAFGAGSLQVELAPGANVRDLIAHISGLAQDKGLPPAQVAVNQTIAQLDSPIRTGDEVALIPPIAGG